MTHFVVAEEIGDAGVWPDLLIEDLVLEDLGRGVGLVPHQGDLGVAHEEGVEVANGGRELKGTCKNR